MKENKIPKIEICITRKNSMATLLIASLAFAAGVLYGKVSMAKYQEKEEEING